ncbi:MAG TPA: Type 1 glutamine amidotransferase-like domain-containing protein [Solirubrobacteraceae bacterium]|nr:Type 1 glutamine amidotransferase-like domain-containing protein [Solirubrobacteraceae bacterium]
MSATRTILALGGGGFTMEPTNPLLDDYVLTLSAAAEPKVLFLPTASGDTTAQINAFYDRFGGRACTPKHASLFRLDELDQPLEDVVMAHDIVYVGGGSMRNLLAIWRAHELDRILAAAWRRGVVMAGLSAGAMCWFEGGVSRSGGSPEPLPGLGLLPGSLSVHADGEPDRLPVWLDCLRSGTLPGGWAAEDGVGLLFRGTKLERAVSSRAGAQAQRVDAVEGELVRERIEPDLLGAHGAPAPTMDDDVREYRRVQRIRGQMRGRLHRFEDI